MLSLQIYYLGQSEDKIDIMLSGSCKLFIIQKYFSHVSAGRNND